MDMKKLLKTIKDNEILKESVAPVLKEDIVKIVSNLPRVVKFSDYHEITFVNHILSRYINPNLKCKELGDKILDKVNRQGYYGVIYYKSVPDSGAIISLFKNDRKL